MDGEKREGVFRTLQTTKMCLRVKKTERVIKGNCVYLIKEKRYKYYIAKNT